MNQSKYLSEEDIEKAAIAWLLKQPPYQFLNGPEIKRDLKKVVLEDRLAAYYRAAQYTVLPSLQWLNGQYIKRPELMGLVVFESFHCGTPAIGSNVSGLAEVLTVNGMPIVEPDLPSLQEALAAHYGDAAKRAELAGRALRAAPSVTWDGVVDRCVDLYRRIL